MADRDISSYATRSGASGRDDATRGGQSLRTGGKEGYGCSVGCGSRYVAGWNHATVSSNDLSGRAGNVSSGGTVDGSRSRAKHVRSCGTVDNSGSWRRRKSHRHSGLGLLYDGLFNGSSASP